MELELLKESFSICRLSSPDDVDMDAEFTFFSRTDGELSLVCPTKAAPDCEKRVDGRRALRVKGALDFSLVGVIAKISNALAEKKIPVFVVSTYDTDYIFVEEARLDEAVAALEGAGCEVSS